MPSKSLPEPRGSWSPERLRAFLRVTQSGDSLLQNPQSLLVAGRASPPRPGGPGLPLPLRGPLVLDLNSSLALVCPEDTSFNPFSIYPTPSCSSGPHTDPASSRKPFPDQPCPQDAPSLQGPWLHHSTVGSRLPGPALSQPLPPLGELCLHPAALLGQSWVPTPWS